MVKNLVKIKLVGVLMVLMLSVCIQPTFAISEGVSVTKSTQVELGLDFTLSAERVSERAVLVRMEIPKKGKLQNLKKVRMTIGQGTPLLSCNLETSPGENGSLVVQFQLSPHLADKCSIDLVTAKVPATPRSYESYYAVELKGYVTGRK